MSLWAKGSAEFLQLCPGPGLEGDTVLQGWRRFVQSTWTPKELWMSFGEVEGVEEVQREHYLGFLRAWQFFVTIMNFMEQKWREP